MHPELAKEADGWDPSTVLAGSDKKRLWKCSLGHRWEAHPNNRCLGKGCPYCGNKKVLKGFNDLQTNFPELAKEANGWNPSTVLAGSDKKMSWKCSLGHEWQTRLSHRTTGLQSGCPYCGNKKVLKGFNDLATTHPQIVKEVDGWDSTTLVAGSDKKMSWKCSLGHKWKARVCERALKGTGCPECAEYGFNPGKPAWFYLMERPDQQQLGITNDLSKRMKHHASFGWIKLDVSGPHDGQLVLDTETLLKKWLRKEIGLVPEKTENWYTSKMEVHSLAELKEKSGIETSIF